MSINDQIPIYEVENKPESSNEPVDEKSRDFVKEIHHYWFFDNFFAKVFVNFQFKL